MIRTCEVFCLVLYPWLDLRCQVSSLWYTIQPRQNLPFWSNSNDLKLAKKGWKLTEISFNFDTSWCRKKSISPLKPGHARVLVNRLFKVVEEWVLAKWVTPIDRCTTITTKGMDNFDWKEGYFTLLGYFRTQHFRLYSMKGTPKF
jgi:hypothetical protein